VQHHHVRRAEPHHDGRVGGGRDRTEPPLEGTMTTTTAADAPTKRRRLDLSRQVFIGLAAGVAVGLLVGERAAALQGLAGAYVQLRQMTVLLCVVVSLVGGLGSMQRGEASRLGARVGLVLLVLWGIALLAVMAFPLMFPTVESASFFSTTLLEESPPLDIVGQ